MRSRTRPPWLRGGPLPQHPAQHWRGRAGSLPVSAPHPSSTSSVDVTLSALRVSGVEHSSGSLNILPEHVGLTWTTGPLTSVKMVVVAFLPSLSSVLSFRDWLPLFPVSYLLLNLFIYCLDILTRRIHLSNLNWTVFSLLQIIQRLQDAANLVAPIPPRGLPVPSASLAWPQLTPVPPWYRLASASRGYHPPVPGFCSLHHSLKAVRTFRGLFSVLLRVFAL